MLKIEHRVRKVIDACTQLNYFVVACFSNETFVVSRHVFPGNLSWLTFRMTMQAGTIMM